MKRKILMGLGFIISMSLSSCNQTLFDKNIEFFEKNNVDFCYFGEESNIFKKIKSYHEFSRSGCPRPNLLFSIYAIDIYNKQNLLTVDFLNQIFETFYEHKAVYIVLMNFHNDLSILKDSYFYYEWAGASEKYVDYDTVIYFNNIGRYSSVFPHSFVYNNEEENTIDSYHKSIIDLCRLHIKNELLNQ
ncbi:MAG: hypothetical protein RR734_04790 [Bacilli bacterium]